MNSEEENNINGRCFSPGRGGNKMKQEKKKEDEDPY